MDQNLPLRLPIKLLPGERLVSIEKSPAITPVSPPSFSLSDITALQQLAGGSQLPGPMLAALPSPEHIGDPEHELYEVLFGRDSLRVALDVMPFRPALARKILIELARLQGSTTYVRREEENGKIVHEDRDSNDPVARKLTEERGWEWPYYGSVDATPEFVRTIAAYCQTTPEGFDLLNQTFVNKDGHEQTMLTALESAISWIAKRLDANPEGLLEHHPAFPGSMENQVWRDSWDSFFHKNGDLANSNQGIAALDVQRVTMDALLDAADIFKHVSQQTDQITKLRTRAEKLRQIILDRFWVDKAGGYFVLGTDRDDQGKLRPLEIQTSDMGHVLHSRLLVGDQPEIVRRKQALIRNLFSPHMLSINGIRTLSDQEIRFRPGAYHNGSVWAWDNYLIAQGLQKHGYYYLGALIDNLLINGVTATNRFPEYWRGDPDDAVPHQLNTQRVVVWDGKLGHENIVEQPPQDIQAWTVAAIFAIKSYNGNDGTQRHMLKPPTPFEQEILNNITQRSDYWRRKTAAILPVI